ncbi:MAG TPA: nitroreductase/quinone reductase family protein [Ktedonobacterales bacterium]
MSGPSNYNQTIIETFRANGGKVPGWARMLLLTTTGAKTGKQRTSPLAYSTDDGRLVVAASKGGAPTNPSWYSNLVANPTVTVELDSERFQARATPVTDVAERDRLYAQHAELMPGFADYEKKTTRKIPVVLLERTS